MPLSRHLSSTTPTPIKLTLYTLMLLMTLVELSSPKNTDGTEFPIAFLSHTFSETHCKWSTTKKEAFGSLLHAITKWNYYLQGANIIVQNDYKPLAQLLNGKNANNKVNRWSLELATYSITFKWISRAKNKAADCLSRLVLPTGNSINMLTASVNDGPAFHTRSHTNTSDFHFYPSSNTSTTYFSG